VIVLFTDFGPSGPYVGQVKAVLYREAPGIPVIDLCADAPAYDPKSSAYLLAAWVSEFPADSVFLCVVDPGVGGTRRPVVVRAGDRWFVGPDNGLFNIVARRAYVAHRWAISWRPARLSATFHGRDLFAPVAASIARGETPPGVLQHPSEFAAMDWPEDLAQVIYIDHYGNAVTGLRAAGLPRHAELEINGRRVRPARTFSDTAPGEALWYPNSSGLAEIAVNQGKAAQELCLRIGDTIAARG
jgi:S-adenosyl-L-methionine hydrolase (adenosine-forming)